MRDFIPVYLKEILKTRIYTIMNITILYNEVFYNVKLE